jgi:hypothetical protein
LKTAGDYCDCSNWSKKNVLAFDLKQLRGMAKFMLRLSYKERADARHKKSMLGQFVI